MRTNTALTIFTVLVGILSVALPGYPQQPTVDTPKARQVSGFVDKAAALINSKGKAAFPEFRKGGSEWLSGDLYIFVGDMKGIALVNAGFPKLEGTDVSANKDANGKLVTMELINTAQSKGAGWVEYMWPKPGQSQPARKLSYVRAAKADGTPVYVGAGFYPE